MPREDSSKKNIQVKQDSGRDRAQAPAARTCEEACIQGQDHYGEGTNFWAPIRRGRCFTRGKWNRDLVDQSRGESFDESIRKTSCNRNVWSVCAQRGTIIKADQTTMTRMLCSGEGLGSCKRGGTCPGTLRCHSSSGAGLRRGRKVFKPGAEETICILGGMTLSGFDCNGWTKKERSVLEAYEIDHRCCGPGNRT